MKLLDLPGRVPLRLRVFFRGVFLLLGLATLALAVSVLHDEKQRSHRNYEDGLRKNQAQIAARLRHPTGQLALLNPRAAERPAVPLRPWVLPFSAIDFDDKAKAQQAAEMAGCLVQYADAANLCVGVGNNPYAGGFIYVVGSFASGDLVSHTPGDLDLSGAHRVRIEVTMGDGSRFAWIAPFEAMAGGGAPGVRGRLTGFDAGQPITPATRPVRDFRGWLWQDGRCLSPTTAPPTAVSPTIIPLTTEASGCTKRSFMSVRLPVEVFREALFRKPLLWPPADLDQIAVQVQVFAPGDAPPLFNSNAPGASLPFSLADLRSLLLPGETLRVHKLAASNEAGTELFKLSGASEAAASASPWIDRLIRQLPVEGYDAPIESRALIATPLGRYELVLSGDVRSVNKNLAAVASRLSWFVGAMLLAIGLAWFAIEVRIIRRITLLTRRAAALSTGVRADDGLLTIDLADLRSRDELGVLAQALQDLLRRVGEDTRREQIRAAQEQDMWHAVGHEIMSPLQSLLALHGDEGDASQRYIVRMQQAVRVLYGHASPSEAFESKTLQLQAIDLDAFLAQTAANAHYADIADVQYARVGAAVPVRADEYSLEDVVTHVLRNADRYRPAGTAIRLGLEFDEAEARVVITNFGPAIPPDMIAAIFEYGVSDQTDAGAQGQRGQGLFVARTYMAKMGGTIAVANTDDGVAFTLTLQRLADAPLAR